MQSGPGLPLLLSQNSHTFRY